MSSAPPPSIADRLRKHGQDHLLRFWDELSAEQRASLVRQIEAVDFELIERLLAEANHPGGPSIRERAERAKPPRHMVRLPRTAAEREQWQRAARAGRETLDAGRVGIILVAGGQGTRLGFKHAKGMFPIGPVSGKSLFQILAEQAAALGRRYTVSIPYCVMTSDATHEETVAFFTEHDFFGLNRDDVFFFRQGNMPAVDAQTGRLLLADKDRLALSPDGHGGLLEAMAGAGLLQTLRERGIEYLFYHQVDNPTIIVCEPAFIGFHVLREAELTTKVVSKRNPDEKMGVVVDIDGRTEIIEYSDMPAEIAALKDESGGLLHWAGSTGVHVFSRTFLQRLIDRQASLPFHLAHKRVEYIDERGQPVVPKEPNAWKFERFIFDAMLHARTALVVEADRAREFNPVKNAEGEDSPRTAQAAMTRIFRKWLREAGAAVSDDVPVEISPLLALDAEELKAKIEPGQRFDGPVYLA